MKYGARNQIEAKVKKIKKGTVMAQVDLSVSKGAMCSVLTADSLEDLGIESGDKVKVVVKAVHVLIVKD